MGTLMTFFVIVFFQLEVRVAFIKTQKENLENPFG